MSAGRTGRENPGFGRLQAHSFPQLPVDAAYFMDRVLDPLAACLNRGAALSILVLRIDPEICARFEVLAERANEGTLTADERPSI